MINSKYSALYFSFSTGHCKLVEMKKEKEEKNPNKKRKRGERDGPRAVFSMFHGFLSSLKNRKGIFLRIMDKLIASSCLRSLPGL